MLVERTSYWDLALFLFLILRGSALFFLFFLTKDTFLVSFYTLTLYLVQKMTLSLNNTTLSLFALKPIVATLMPYYSLPDYPNICITNFLELYRVQLSKEKISPTPQSRQFINNCSAYERILFCPPANRRRYNLIEIYINAISFRWYSLIINVTVEQVHQTGAIANNIQNTL